LVLLGFQTPHNIPSLANSRGIRTTDPLCSENLSDDKKKLWVLASEVICSYKPSFQNRQYAVQFAKMTPEANSVPYHHDKHDIGPQYHVALGSYSGAHLECFDPYNRSTGLFFGKPYLMLKLDGRLGHQIHITNFKRFRYSMIFYQLFDENQNYLKKICYPPRYIFIK